MADFAPADAFLGYRGKLLTEPSLLMSMILINKEGGRNIVETFTGNVLRSCDYMEGVSETADRCIPKCPFPEFLAGAEITGNR